MTSDATFDALKVKGDALAKEKKFSEALALFNEMCTKYSQFCSEWDWWHYGQCLRKEKKSEQALDACRTAYLELKKKSSKDTKSSTISCIYGLYAWCIYDCEIKGKEKYDEEKLIKAVEGIEKLVNKTDEMSPYVPAIFALIEHYELQNKTKKMLEWTSKIDPQTLSVKASSFTKKDGKEVKVASNKEKWYSLHSKALLENELFDKCIKLCEEALSLTEIQPLHYDNELWFQRRIAQCETHKKNYSKAISLLQNVYLKKKECFIQHDLAEVYYAMGDFKLAYKFALTAAVSNAPLEFKGKLFELLAKILSKNDHVDKAGLHILLDIKLHDEKGWKVSDELKGKAQSLKVDLSDSRTSNQLLSELMKFWNKELNDVEPPLTGKIDRLLGSGKGGFIRTDDGNSYYFKVSSVVGKHHINGGEKVSFTLEDSFDKKKGTPSKAATNIHLIYV